MGINATYPRKATLQVSTFCTLRFVQKRHCSCNRQLRKSSATNQRHWRVKAQLKTSKSGSGEIGAVSAMTIQLDIHIKERFLHGSSSCPGIAMSIFIGFRNTQAISRWWEALTLLRLIVNKSRVWADSLCGLLNEQQWRSKPAQLMVQLQAAII